MASTTHTDTVERRSSSPTTPPVRLFEAISFSNEEEIILLKEYKDFLDSNPPNLKSKKWVQFREVFSLAEKFDRKQISKKMSALEHKFHTDKIDSSSSIFKLCESLWGPKKRSLVVTSDDDERPAKKRLTLTDSEVEELELYCKTLTLKLRQLRQSIAEKEDNLDEKGEKKKKKKKKKKDQKRTSPQGESQPFELAIEELEDGNPNGKIVYEGAKVKIHITAKVKGNEEVFESSIGHAPHIINLGSEEVIEGLRTGLKGMHVGGKRRLHIPPYLGYGDEGFEGVVPPNSWLVYEVQLLDVGHVSRHSR